MKNASKIFTIIALIAVIGFTVASCDNGNSPGPGPGAGGSLIEGKFASQTGTGDAVFFADYTSANRSARNVAGMHSTDKELIGKIQDGDITFNLSGIYNTVSKQFFLSAGSSFLIFEIGGVLSSGGTITDTRATVKVASGGDWEITVVDVTTANDVTIESSASNQQEAGIPSSWFGRWKNEQYDEEEDETYTTILMMTAFQLSDVNDPDMVAGFINITGSGTSRTMVWSTVAIIEEWEGGPGGSTLINRETFPIFFKVVIKEQGQGLLMEQYGQGIWDDDWEEYTGYYLTYEAANAVATTGSPNATMAFTRP